MSSALRASSVLILTMISWSSGCGASSSGYKAPVIQEIKGKITFLGEPLIAGRVSFENADTDRQTTAEIQKDGTFSIGPTTKSGGLPVGMYRVIIMKGETNTYETLPREYLSFPSTPLKIEILAQQSDYPINIVVPQEPSFE